MERDFLFETEEAICGLRAAAVFVRDNKILAQREKSGKEYALPGGHVKIGETLEAGLIRELQEELGLSAICKKLLWSEECFWRWKGKQAHNICFYYQIEPREGGELPAEKGFVPQKDNPDVLAGWLPLEELDQVILYPAFLKTEIHNLDGPMKHFISEG